MSSIYFLPCFCSDSNDVLNKFSCLLCAWLQYLYINSKDTVTWIKTLVKNFLSFASGHLVKLCVFYPLLSLETVFLPLKLKQIC